MALPPDYPPHRAVSVQEYRDLESRARAAGVQDEYLMDVAGRALALVVTTELGFATKVTILCGPGNNGGDGYACAHTLTHVGIHPYVVACSPGPPSSPPARAHYERAVRQVEVVHAWGDGAASVVRKHLRTGKIVVDALFGVGLSRPLEAPYPEIVAVVNGLRPTVRRISADVPSGIEADTGEPMPVAVRADMTIAMGLVKRGCRTPRGAAFAGEVVEADVGFPDALLRRFLA
jgi:NAD(P)H-hydrate epimerase